MHFRVKCTDGIYGGYSYNCNSFSRDARSLAVSLAVGYIQGSKPKLIARDPRTRCCAVSNLTLESQEPYLTSSKKKTVKWCEKGPLFYSVLRILSLSVVRLQRYCRYWALWLIHIKFNPKNIIPKLSASRRIPRIKDPICLSVVMKFIFCLGLV